MLLSNVYLQINWILSLLIFIMFVICAKVFLFFFWVLFENTLFGVSSKLFCFIEIRLFCMRSAFYVDVLLWCDNIPTLSELFKSKTHICLTSRNINRGRLWTFYIYCIDLVLSCDSISCFFFCSILNCEFMGAAGTYHSKASQ